MLKILVNLAYPTQNCRKINAKQLCDFPYLHIIQVKINSKKFDGKTVFLGFHCKVFATIFTPIPLKILFNTIFNTFFSAILAVFFAMTMTTKNTFYLFLDLLFSSYYICFLEITKNKYTNFYLFILLLFSNNALQVRNDGI